MAEPWDAASPGVLVLPNSRRVRGRSLRARKTGNDASLAPTYSIRLTTFPNRSGETESNSVVWVPFPDFCLPLQWKTAAVTFRNAYECCSTERVEIACGGGRGRTGVGLACLCICDGLSSADAINYVREHYDSHAVETAWQSWWVSWFAKQA